MEKKNHADETIMHTCKENINIRLIILQDEKFYNLLSILYIHACTWLGTLGIKHCLKYIYRLRTPIYSSQLLLNAEYPEDQAPCPSQSEA